MLNKSVLSRTMHLRSVNLVSFPGKMQMIVEASILPELEEEGLTCLIEAGEAGEEAFTMS